MKQEKKEFERFRPSLLPNAGKLPKKWNILFEGPSALEVERKDLIAGPLMAVNWAIRASSWLPVGVWSQLDAPSKIMPYCLPWVPNPCILFTSKNYVELWKRIGWPSDRIWWEHPSMLGEKTEKGEEKVLPSMFTILGTLFNYGVTDIKMFGADWFGTGNAFSMEPTERFLELGLDKELDKADLWVKDEPARMSKRWLGERQAYKVVRKKMKKRNCLITRVNPYDDPKARLTFTELKERPEILAWHNKWVDHERGLTVVAG